MKNLLFFVSDFRIGVSSLLVDELEAFAKSGLPIVAIGGEKEQEEGLVSRVQEANIDLRRIEGLDDHKNFSKTAKRIAEIIQSQQIAIVHVQNNWQLALCTYCRHVLRQKIEIIYTLHGFRNNSAWKSVVAQVIIGLALSLFADKIICMCSFLRNKFRILSYKIVVLPLGVPDSFYASEKNEIKTDVIRAIFPAQFRQGKNQNMLIESFSKYIKDKNDRQSCLILPGSGPMRDAAMHLAKELGSENQIQFPGQCTKEEILALYRQCNIGVVSSNSETFGQCIVEPFVLGRCLITRRVGVAQDIIEESVNGFYFKDTKDLYNIFCYLHDNMSLIKTIGENNFAKRDFFRWKSIAENYKCKLIQ